MAGAETTSLDEAIPGTEDYTLADTIADDFNLEESVVDSVGDQQVQAVIWGAVSDLGGKEADIVVGYYKNGETLDNLSNRLEITDFQRTIKPPASSSSTPSFFAAEIGITGTPSNASIIFTSMEP